MRQTKDWTVGPSGKSNTSRAFERIVEDVARVLSDHRVGDAPIATATLIVARLAHVFGMTYESSADGR